MKASIKRILLVTALMAAAPLSSKASVFVSVSFGPPALPVYEQPVCPGDGYLWTPGYWAFAEDAYYWVPGTWVMAPQPGLLWTPGYWAYESSAYFWRPGYWGPRVGFYGGVNYGYGYSGVGYQGGYWNHNQFNYNRTVNNINVTNVTNVTNVYKTYNAPVINNNPGSHVAYNGGPGGLHARPSAQEQGAMREPHYQWTHNQLQNEQLAKSDPLQRVSRDHERPGVFAASTPASFHGPGAVTESRGEASTVMPQRGVPHAPVLSYDQHGRGQIERASETTRPQSHAPQYRYTQDAPQPSRPVQSAPVQHSPANAEGRQAQPWQGQRTVMNAPEHQAPRPSPAETQRHAYREDAPQAHYPQTMAQFHPQPTAPRMNAQAPGAYQPTAQSPRERAMTEQPHAGGARPPQGLQPQHLRQSAPRSQRDQT